MKVLVASEADEASRSQRTALLDLASWSEDALFEGNATWRHRDLFLVTIREHHLYRDSLDVDLAAHFGVAPEFLVYLSKHRSESGTPSLTVHPLGNFREARFGGLANTLVPSAPRAMTSALRGLAREAAGLAYAVTFEATHHGPFLESPAFYIEQGSGEREWSDASASRAIARTLLHLSPEQEPVAIGLGGGHYVPRHTDLALERKIALGHMLPAHVLEEADDEILGQAIRKTPDASLAYVHRKSLTRAKAREWEDRVRSHGLRVVREGDLDLREEEKGS